MSKHNAKRKAVAEGEVLKAALLTCQMLKQAYENGEADGGEMDWNDVDQAHDQALHALSLERRFRGLK